MRKYIPIIGILALLASFTSTAFAQSNVRPMYDDRASGGVANQDVTVAKPLPVQIGASGTSTTPSTVYQKTPGTTTWTKTTVTLNGSSQNALAASTTRVGFMLYNPSANGNVYVDISGGTVASETGVLLAAGARFSVTGSATPKTAITVIGTNTQSLIVWEGN